MNLQSLYHINVNCSDFERSLAFYKKLGFSELYDLDVVEGRALAEVLGLDEPRGRAAILQLDDHPRACRVDLIEWTSPKPIGETPSTLNHIGFARLCFYTKDIWADYEELKSEGIETLSAPKTLEFSDGSRAEALCFKDPDGTVLELVGFGKES